MKLLFVSSEVAPWSKTGGLGDVAGALPRALARLGHEVKVVTPLYGSIAGEAGEAAGTLRLRFPHGEQRATLRVLGTEPRHEVVFLDAPGLYGRPGIYGDANGDYGDNHRRFGFLGVGSLSAAQQLGFSADIVHLNDWQTGLAAVALRRGYLGTELGRARSVFTIHNLAYQGIYPKGIMGDLGLPWDLFTAEGLEFHDSVNFLKAGLTAADALTTVSWRYSQEIQTPEQGGALAGLLRRRSGELHGIVNGIDYTEWNPAADPHLPAAFQQGDLGGKAICKRELLARMGLPDDRAEQVPVYGLVGRLVEQKGIELLVKALPRMLEADIRVVVLGSGEGRFEHALEGLARHFPHKLAVRTAFDNPLAHLIEAGSDFFFMPSLYEPCGLNQMYSLRYGTVPIVRATGGLDDTVVDVSAPRGTGVKFHDYHPDALLQAVWRSLALYWNEDWLAEVRGRGMGTDFSWEASAKRYEALYRSLLLR